MEPPSFAEIDARRDAERIPIVHLCKLAGIDYSTYWRIRSGRQEVQFATRKALARALKNILNSAKERK